MKHRRRYLLVLIAVLSVLLAVGVTLMMPPSEYKADYNRISIGMTSIDVDEGFGVRWGKMGAPWSQEVEYVSTDMKYRVVVLYDSNTWRVREKRWEEESRFSRIYKRIFGK